MRNVQYCIMLDFEHDASGMTFYTGRFPSLGEKVLESNKKHISGGTFQASIREVQMPNSEDRRVRITKMAIRDSLIELMEVHPISKISVKLLCETADINRSTFYAHYKDQYDLLRSVQQEIVVDVTKQIAPAHLSEVSDSAIAVLVKVLNYGRDNAPLLKVLLSEHGDSSFQEELMELAQEKLMDEFLKGDLLSAHTIEYLKHFALGGFLNIMRLWLDNNCADEPEIVAELMMTLIVQGTAGLVNQSK